MIKNFSMFYKRRQWVAPPWWAAFNQKQNEYARRLADFLGRRAVKVPVARMRVYVVLFLMGMAGLELGMTWYSITERRAERPAVVLGTPEQLVIQRSGHPVAGKGLRFLLDSLRDDRVAGKQLDSLLRARPGLADTLRRLEGMDR